MIRIVTDTSADITRAQAAEMGVELVPLSIRFGDKTYAPLEDESFSIFYEMLAHEKDMPTSSQPAPAQFLSVYEEAKAAGDDVVVITISGMLSGTVQSANVAKEMLGYDRVFVIDSLSAVIGQRLLVEMAVKMRDEGKPAEEIAKAIEDARNRVVLVAGLDTLKYLRKGGRIPKSMEIMGTVLGIKPMVELVNGTIESAGKARGSRRMMEAMLELLAQRPPIDESMPVYFGYTLNADNAEKVRGMAVEKNDYRNTVLYPIGSVVGTHLGPDAVVIVYLGKQAS